MGITAVSVSQVCITLRRVKTGDFGAPDDSESSHSPAWNGKPDGGFAPYANTLPLRDCRPDTGPSILQRRLSAPAPRFQLVSYNRVHEETWRIGSLSRSPEHTRRPQEVRCDDNQDHQGSGCRTRPNVSQKR